MNVTVKKLPKAQVELTIVVDSESMERGKRLALNDIRNEVELKGFRKGKAPDQIIIAHFGEEYITSHGSSFAIDEAFRKAIVDEKIRVVGQPTNLEVVKKDPFTFTLICDVIPEIDVKGYEKIKIAKEAIKVDKKEVEAAIAEIQQRFTTFNESTDGTVENGDRATIAFDGFDAKSGEPLAGTSSKGHPMMVGQGTFIPGFEEEMIGMKAGEEKDFEITFPKEYHQKDFQNKKVKFHVKIEKLEKAKKQEIDEAFIEQIRGKKMTVSEFEDQIKHQIEHEKEHQERDRREGEYLKEGVKKFVTMDIPTPIVEEELDYIEHEMKERIAGYGMNYDDYLNHLGKTSEVMRNEQRAQAEERAKSRLFLSAVLEKEEVEVTDADIDEEIEHIASHYENEQYREQVRKIYKDKKEAREKLMAKTKLKKVFDKLLDGEK